MIGAGMAKNPDERYATTRELAQAAQAAPKVVVVAKPVARPVRTVVVHRSGARQVPAAQQTTTRARATAPTRRRTTTTASRPAPAPKATQAAPATKTTGS